MHSSLILLAIAGLAYAAPAPAPAPQDIDFDLAYAAPEPTYTVADGATAQIVTYDASSVYASAIPQITATTDASSPASTAVSGIIEKRAACTSQPSGYGPTPSVDSPSAFAAFSSFSALASAAPVPSGYTQTFVNLNAANNAYVSRSYSKLSY